MPFSGRRKEKEFLRLVVLEQPVAHGPAYLVPFGLENVAVGWHGRLEPRIERGRVEPDDRHVRRLGRDLPDGFFASISGVDEKNAREAISKACYLEFEALAFDRVQRSVLGVGERRPGQRETHVLQRLASNLQEELEAGSRRARRIDGAQELSDHQDRVVLRAPIPCAGRGLPRGRGL